MCPFILCFSFDLLSPLSLSSAVFASKHFKIFVFLCFRTFQNLCFLIPVFPYTNLEVMHYFCSYRDYS